MIQGKWHDNGSAAQFNAALRLNNGIFIIEIEDHSTRRGNATELSISDRLGNVERKLTLPDGSIFVTKNNDDIDLLFLERGSFTDLLHQLEKSIGWAVVALVITVLASGAFLKWGIPWTSHKLAHALPHKTNELIAAHTLTFLDDYVFEEESDIDPKRAEEITARFKQKLIPLERNNTDITYRLHFRKWVIGDDDEGIPNALALPSGDIILTDQFLALTQSDDEIDAVLLHEIGHVVQRHTLQMVIQGTLLSTVIMVATGESSGLADMGLGLGAILISSNYSRGHESEADLYAFEKMLEAQIDPNAFATIMDRMTRYMEDLSDHNEQTDTDTDKNKTNITDYLSSHPNTTNRIEHAKHYSQCFHKGLLECPQFESKPNNTPH